jgi:hypothetical protein
VNIVIDQWRALVNIVVDLCKLLENSRAAAQLPASEEGLSSMKLVNHLFSQSYISLSLSLCSVNESLLSQDVRLDS